MFESTYVSKRLDYHPDNLAECAAQWHRGLLPVPWVRGTVRVSDGFWLASTCVLGCADENLVYRAQGLAWVGARPVPLGLEFSKWSETESEVGVVPRGLSWPVGTDRYVHRVLAGLEVISQALCPSTRQVSLLSDPTAPSELRVVDRGSRVPASERSIRDLDTPVEVRVSRFSACSGHRVPVPACR
jgi:hypothetical protein